MENQKMPSIQGWPVLRIWRGSVYIRIPSDLARPIDGGCKCDYCNAHPLEVPAWDTLGVPLNQARATTWTLHAPGWRSSDKIDKADRGAEW